MRKIGIFGGTFDPIHNGHKNAAVYFKNALELDSVLVIPTAVPPHKDNRSATTENQRLEMVKLAFSDFKGFEVSDIEIKKGGKSYTVDTVISLKEKYKDSMLYLYTGTDMFLYIEKWKDFRYLLDNTVLVCASREKDDKDKIFEYKKRLEELYNAKIILLDNNVIDVSSTMIRAEITKNQDVSKFLPSNVFSYIKENELYKNQYLDVLKTMQSGHRLMHSMSVQKEAIRLSKRYGVDEEKASIAGILHDVTKKCSKEDQLTLLSQFGIIPDIIQKENPKLLHAVTGFGFCKNILKIDDDEILSAIRYHTTGKPCMTNLEKIIFLADMTEPLRDFQGVDELRKKVDSSLDEGMAFCLKVSLEKLTKDNVPIHEDTVRAYEYYKEYLNG